jgi:hypothetical protein
MIARLMLLNLVAGLIAIFTAPGSSAGDDVKKDKAMKEEVQKAEKALREKYAPLSQSNAPPLTHLEDAALRRSFPDALFFSVIYRQYPVAKLAPEGMKSQNVFLVTKDGKVEHLTSAKELEKYFRTNLDKVTSEDTAKDATRSWLALSQQFYHDGFFRFKIPDKELSGSAKKMTGKAVVEPKNGDKGFVQATLNFDDDGKLAKVEETSTLKVGVRPICQATKLLDPDAIVRGMAEQCLLIMGSAAKEYLDEQRAKASPELQQAIDRMWRRIVEEER